VVDEEHDWILATMINKATPDTAVRVAHLLATILGELVMPLYCQAGAQLVLLTCVAGVTRRILCFVRRDLSFFRREMLALALANE